MRWAGHVVHIGARRDVHRILVREPEGKRTLGNPGINGRIILRRILRKWNGGIDWIETTQDRESWRAFVHAVMNLRVL